jgi:hypothetical protein
MSNTSSVTESMRRAQAAYEAAGASLTDWSEQPKEPRDLKKLFLIAGLAILSWVATYVGMLELIEANMGDLPIIHKVIIGFSVAMLMTMVVWLLDQLFAPIGFVTKACYAFGYVFLSLISIGFGFGFYWKVLESKSEGTRGAETAITQVQAPLSTAASRLESLGKTLDTLQTTSAQKAEIERTQGTSCPNSKPGDGPRRKLRDDDAARFAFARDVVKGRIEKVKTDISAIDADLALITKNDAAIIDKSGTRNDFMKTLNRKLDGTVNNFNAFKGDPQLKQIRVELDERANKTQFIDTQGKPYSCPDQGLASMIRSVVASIDALPTLDKPKIATVEGSDATIEAFRRLTATFYGALAFKLPPSVDELRDMQKKAISSVEGGKLAPVASLEQAGLSKRDYIPLAIAVFVDLCLLLVSMGRPANRLGNLVPKMQAAERGPVIQILSRFNEIHKDRQIRENFEIFRHVVFDLNGDYYVAVPLDAPPRMNPKDREELRLEAQLLSNLFTSFEKEKIFSRVLMPYISVKQIQKKLWKQGSKFAHAETFRLYKFKDGAWSEIILGAIMGAAKRVETEKLRRRIEDDVFTRHEPRFTGAISEVAADAATGHPLQQPSQSYSTGRPVPPPPTQPLPPFQPYQQAPQHQTYAYTVQPAQGPPAYGSRGPASVAMQQAFGPYAHVAPQPAQPPEPTADVRNVAAHPHFQQNAARRVDPASLPQHQSAGEDETVADLLSYKQKLEAQADVSVRVANNNTAPPAATHQEAIAPNVIALPQAAMPRSEPVQATLEPAAAPTMRIEAVERRVIFSVPSGDKTTMPAALAAMLSHSAKSDPEAVTQSNWQSSEPALIEHAPTQIASLANAIANAASKQEASAWTAVQPIVVDQIETDLGGETDDNFLPWTGPADDDIPTMASRFAPGTPRS